MFIRCSSVPMRETLLVSLCVAWCAQRASIFGADGWTLRDLPMPAAILHNIQLCSGSRTQTLTI